MKQHSELRVLVGIALSAPALFAFASCSSKPSATDSRGPAAGEVSDAADPYPGVNAVSHDRAVWQQLLGNHEKIRRTVTYTSNGVEATTESDDPAVAAKIIEHAKAMQARVKTGAMVRVWDPVFADLFDKHSKIKLEITQTDKGVRIVESSDDAETVAVLWSHAAGVSEFVREGPVAARRETAQIKPGSPPPSPESVAAGAGQ